MLKKINNQCVSLSSRKLFEKLPSYLISEMACQSEAADKFN